MSVDDTIAAISTAAGEGAIALVRVSGARAIDIAEQVFRGKKTPRDFESHTQHLGEIVQNGSVIDHAMLAVHRAPGSYTGEDLIEISCHGGMLVTSKVLETCLRVGARMANPGEFTERAYLNHKLDITQAEAVIDLIRAQSDLALRSASEQLRGRLGEEFQALRQELIGIIAHVEAAMDFPEEGISPDTIEKVAQRLSELRDKIGAVMTTARTGRILREGLRVVIFGATNAGKSSLFNRLLGFERAIVSDVPGTTRDTIEEAIDLRGIALRLIDSAGLRIPENTIEHEGMRRTGHALETADFRLHLVDANAPRPANCTTSANELLILNKSDLPEHRDWRGVEGLRISCKTGAGFTDLEETIFRRIGGAKLKAESPLAVNSRHCACLANAERAISRAIAQIRFGSTPEMFAVDLHEAQQALNDLLGGGDEEAVRNAIFSQFCIGK